MNIDYHFLIDDDDDGQFTQTGDNIRADVIRAEWQLGMARPYDAVSAVAQATLTVRNWQRHYSPEASGKLIGKPLTIISDDGTPRTHFSGFIAQVIPQTGDQGQREAQIIAYGRERELAQQTVRLPPAINWRADHALDAILTQIHWRYPRLVGMCIIGQSTIGNCEIFAASPLTIHADQGRSVFAFMADDWAEGLPADQAVLAIMRGEGGRFFFNRVGEAVFYHRHHLLSDTAPNLQFDNRMSALDYRYGDVINQVTVTLTPRRIGAPFSTLWSLVQTMRIAPDSTLTLTARYQLEGQSVGAVDVSAPRPYADYQAYDHPTRTDHDRTDMLQVRMSERGTSASVLELHNPTAQALYLTRLTLNGTPLITGDPLTLTAQDRVRMTYDGLHARQINLPVITDIDEAQSILQWELQRHSQARGRALSLTTDTHQHPHATLALTLFDTIRISETQTDHHADYHIIAEQHSVDAGGTQHRVRWLLEPAERDLFFIIGRHSIGADVVLVPR
ncbi:MAG: hypothetical protein ACFE0Q_08910 [Anaerolineae bacterium]